MNDVLIELWNSRHPEDILFLKLIKGYAKELSENYPNIIFFIKDDKIYIEYDKETQTIWVHEIVWKSFHCNTLSDLIEKYLKIKGRYRYYIS